MSSSNKRTSQCERIHPMDVQMAMFHCADGFLKQLMVTKLSQCQYALPLLIPDPFTQQIEFPLWTFRQIIKSWKMRNTNNEIISQTQPIYKAETPMVFFFRFSSVSLSKSQLMNSLINEKHNTFFHRNCPGSSKTRVLMNGVVEIAWFCPSGKNTDKFTDCVAFCNLHGDAGDHEKQLQILTEIASVNVVLLPRLDRNDRHAAKIQKLYKHSKPLICLIAEDISTIKKRKNHLPFSDLKIVDEEDDDDCRRGREEAQQMMSLLEKKSLTENKESFLPHQGKLWHQWSQKNKELHRPRADETEMEIAFGLEHIMREIGQIYESCSSVRKNKKDLQIHFSSLPGFAAEMMISGFPLELMDGDAAHVPLIWISAVLDQLIQKLGDQRVFVLSGKSTMLNAMFGLQFARSFHAAELAGKSTRHHDNELATFVIGLANLTLINIFGENPTETQDILQIVVQAIMRIKKNVTDITAEEKNEEGRRRLQQTLDEMTKLAAKDEPTHGTTKPKLLKLETKYSNAMMDTENKKKKTDDQKTHHENTLYEKSKELALKLNDKTNDEETLKKDVKKIKDNPPIKDIDIMRDVREILSNINESHPLDHWRDIFSVMILSFNISKMGYNISYIQQLTDYIKRRVTEHEEGPVKYVFKDEFFMDLVLSICKKVNEMITDQHRLFREANDPVIFVEKKREQYYSIFQKYCHGVSPSAIFGEIICQKLKEPIEQSVYKKTTRDLADEMRSNCESLNGNRSNLEKHILKTLAEEEDFDRYMNYMNNPRDHFNNFIRDEVSRYITQKFSVSVLPKMKENIKLLQQKIMKAAHESTEHVQVNSGDVGLWLKIFTQQLSDELIFSEKDLSGVKHDDVDDFSLLEDVIREEITIIMVDISRRFNTETFPSKLNSKFRPDELLIDHFCQCCWVQCPFCKATCTNTIENHDGDHSVPFHRVNGINGMDDKTITN
ncbi:hypothetical protein M9458_007480, partial [Cirrhinus mrigala]